MRSRKTITPSPSSRRRAGADRTRSPRHRPEDARALIIAAALAFLSEKPFRDLTVGGLMAGTPLSRPAFYVYFEDVHELIEVLLGEIEQAMHAAANAWLCGPCDSVEQTLGRVREGLSGIVSACTTHGPLFRAISEAAALDSRLERSWKRFMTRWDEGVAARIRLEQQAGLISKSIDAGEMAYALNRLDSAMLIDRFGKKLRRGESERTLELMMQFWRGMLYPGSRK